VTTRARHPCDNCGDTPGNRAGLCLNCYAYKRRNRVDRPEALVIRTAVRKHETEVWRTHIRQAMGSRRNEPGD
jgi:hypothetical protein